MFIFKAQEAIQPAEILETEPTPLIISSLEAKSRKFIS